MCLMSNFDRVNRALSVLITSWWNMLCSSCLFYIRSGTKAEHATFFALASDHAFATRNNVTFFHISRSRGTNFSLGRTFYSTLCSNVITAEWNAARAGNVISRSEYGKLRRHWETSRIFFQGKSACCTPLANRLFFFVFFLFFHFSMCSLAFVLGPVTVPPLCPRHKRVYAYKSSLFTPRIELKLNFFLYLPLPPREKERKGGEACG